MHKKKHFRYISIALLAMVAACTQNPVINEVKIVTVAFDSLLLKNYADTIVCDMVVKNPDSSDTWMEECLKNFKHSEILTAIFDDLYSGKLNAYDFFSNKLLSASDIRKLEGTKGYKREIIGKFQFREAWFYDKANHTFIKKVHSITFGYETYDENGGVKGYKPLFIVKL
jgi:uncharacterized protein YpuA (DUF1002 family)